MAHSVALVSKDESVIACADEASSTQPFFQQVEIACIDFRNSIAPAFVSLDLHGLEQSGIRSRAERALERFLAEMSAVQAEAEARLQDSRERRQAQEPLPLPSHVQEPLPLPPHIQPVKHVEPVPLPAPPNIGAADVQSLGLFTGAPPPRVETQFAVDSVALGRLPNTAEVMELLEKLDEVNGTIKAIDEMIAAEHPNHNSIGSILTDSALHAASIGTLNAHNVTTLGTVAPDIPATATTTVPGHLATICKDSCVLGQVAPTPPPTQSGNILAVSRATSSYDHLGDARLGNAEDTAGIAALLCSPTPGSCGTSPTKLNPDLSVANCRPCEMSREAASMNMVGSSPEKHVPTDSVGILAQPSSPVQERTSSAGASLSILGIEEPREILAPPKALTSEQSSCVAIDSTVVGLDIVGKAQPHSIGTSNLVQDRTQAGIPELASPRSMALVSTEPDAVTTKSDGTALGAYVERTAESASRNAISSEIVPLVRPTSHHTTSRLGASWYGKRPRLMHWKNVTKTRRFQPPPDSDVIETFTQEGGALVPAAPEEVVQAQQSAAMKHSSEVPPIGAQIGQDSSKEQPEREDFAITQNYEAPQISTRNEENMAGFHEKPPDVEPNELPKAISTCRENEVEKSTTLKKDVVEKPRVETAVGIPAKRRRVDSGKNLKPPVAPSVPSRCTSPLLKATSFELPRALADAPSPSRQQAKQAKEVQVLLTGFASGDYSRYARSVKKLGGVLVQELPSEVHGRLAAAIRIVTPSTLSRATGERQQLAQIRTVKFFDGILAGAWILSPEWITSSTAKGRWLPECDFELDGDTQCQPRRGGGPRLGRNHGSRLFAGLRMHFLKNGKENTVSYQRTRSCLELDDPHKIPRQHDLERFAYRGGAEVLSVMTDILPSSISKRPPHLSAEEQPKLSENLSRGRSTVAWWQLPIAIFPGAAKTELVRGNGVGAGWLHCSHTWMLDCISCGELLDPLNGSTLEDDGFDVRKEELETPKGTDSNKNSRMWKGKVILDVE